jgi:hypothetical protein
MDMELEKMDETTKLLHDLPKYIETEKATYRLILIKQDWDYTIKNSWMVLYAKILKYGYSTVKPILYAEGKTALLSLQDMKIKIDKFREDNKNNPNF